MSTSPIRVVLADDHAVVRKGIREFLTEPGDIEVIAEASMVVKPSRCWSKKNPMWLCSIFRCPNARGLRSAVTCGRSTGRSAFSSSRLMMTIRTCWPCLQAGANGYVLKTADADDIIQAVRDVHEGKSALDPVIARKLMAQLAGRAENKPIETLTPREMDVLKLAARGYTNKAIGAHLHLSDRTVQGHLANIFGKLHVATRTEAVMRAVSLGWLTPEETSA